MTFDEFIAESCQREPRGMLRQWVGVVLSVVSARHRRRLAWAREQERAWPRRVAEIRAICAAMTPEERSEPNTIGYAARQRIAASAGVDSLAVSQLLRARINPIARP